MKVIFQALMIIMFALSATAAEGTEGDYSLVIGSDDYEIHKDAFAKAASDLISSGRYSEDDFREIGGWIKSVNQRKSPIYFTCCGRMAVNNRIYLNVSTGELSN